MTTEIRPEQLKLSSDLRAFNNSADNAAARTNIGANDASNLDTGTLNSDRLAAGVVIKRRLLVKTDALILSGVAAGGNASITGWDEVGGATGILTPSHTASKVGNLVIARLTVGVLAHDDGFVNAGIAIAIDGTFAGQVGDTAGNRVLVGSSGYLSSASDFGSTDRSTLGYKVADDLLPFDIDPRAMNSGNLGAIYINRTEDDVDDASRPRGVSWLEIEEIQSV